MGAHKGWRVRALPSGKHQGSYWTGGRYESETFEKEPHATRWARDKAAQERAAVLSGKMPHAPIPEARTEDVAKAYQAKLTARNRSPRYLVDLKLILDACATACPDLAAPTAAAELEGWIDTLRTNGRGRGGKGRAGKAVSPARRNKYRAIAGQWSPALCRPAFTDAIHPFSMPTWRATSMSSTSAWAIASARRRCLAMLISLHLRRPINTNLCCLENILMLTCSYRMDTRQHGCTQEKH